MYVQVVEVCVIPVNITVTLSGIGAVETILWASWADHHATCLISNKQVKMVLNVRKLESNLDFTVFSIYCTVPSLLLVNIR